MARTNTSKLKLPKHDIGDLNWGGDYNEGLDALDEHAQRETLRPPRTLTATLGSGAVGAYLLGNTTYFYKVTAINSAGETTESKIPAVVEAAVTQGATPVPVLLEWEAVEGASGYRIYKAASSGAEQLLVEKSGGGTVTHTDDGNADTTATPVPGSNTAWASVTGIRKTGEADPLRGDVKLKEGANVTLTQTPGTNEIEIAAAGGGGATVPSATGKGDILAGNSTPEWAVVPPGADGKFLKANSGAAAGVSWDTPAGGGYATAVVSAKTSAAIQAAIDGLPAEGGAIVLQEGTYVIDSVITLPTKPVVIRGQGDGTIITLDGTYAAGNPTLFSFPTGDMSCPVQNATFERPVVLTTPASGGSFWAAESHS